MPKTSKPMNNHRASYFFVPLYLLLLLMVWIGAFFADLAQLLIGSALPSSSLVSAEGVRWALRAVLPSIASLPWGLIMMLIATCALLRGAGLTKVLRRLVCFRRLTVTEWRALLFSAVAAVCYIVLLYMSAVSPWNMLAGVTDEAALSPLVQGWAMLLFVGVLSVSLIYGFIYGNYRSMMDVVVSAGKTFTLFVPALMALLPASGIVPCMQYAGVESILGLSWDTISAILYLLPFIYVMLLETSSQ